MQVIPWPGRPTVSWLRCVAVVSSEVSGFFRVLLLPMYNFFLHPRKLESCNRELLSHTKIKEGLLTVAEFL